MATLIIIWNGDDASKEEYTYATLEEAREAEYGLNIAFGGQIWTAIY